MSRKTIIYYGDLVKGLDAADITTSGATTGYEEEYVQDHTPMSVWQGDAAASTISMDYGSAVYQAAIWVGGTNLVSTDTLHKYGVGAAAAANTVEKSLTKAASAFSEIGETYRYGKYSSTVASGNPEAGKIYVAQYKYVLGNDIQRGFTGGNVSSYITNRGRYGQIHRELQYSKRIYSFDMAGISDVQKEIFDETLREEENVIFWDGELQKAFFGVLTLGEPKFIRADSTGAIWEMSGTFEEAL